MKFLANPMVSMSLVVGGEGDNEVISSSSFKELQTKQ